MGPLILLQERGLEAIGRYYSTYRGTVVDNIDPDKQNRVRVVVPDVDSTLPVWAYPKGTKANANTGVKGLTPELGSTVWIEYELGDPMYPVWQEGHWAAGEMPEDLDDNLVMGIVTPKGNKIIFNEGTSNFKLTILNNNTEDASMEIEIINGKLSIKGLAIDLLDAKIGIPKSDLVTSKLNILENQLNDLKTLFINAPAVAGYQDGGRAAFRSFSSWASNRLNNTEIKDIANDKIKQ